MATNYDFLLENIRNLGMDYRWAGMFVKKLRDDEISFPVNNKDEKKWALERGFFPGRIELYGLTEKNYHDYIPDFHYFMLHPLNNHFLKWLDKTTLKYILNSCGCESTMPDYYVYIENDLCNGRFTYLMDCPDDIPKDKDFLWNLLKKKKVLAMKPNSGTSGGLGFIKLELCGDDIYENNKLINRERFEKICDIMRNYIVTEYACQHHELSKIWSDSECTLRVIMCKNFPKDRFSLASWTNVVSFARFGADNSGGTSNLSAGGVGIGFDFTTGEFKPYGVRYKRFCDNKNWLIDRHPNTGFIWRGYKLPNWQYVKEKIYNICQHISSLDYLGLDIIITENGMKLCEINSHPALDYSQVLSGAVLGKSKVKDFFEQKGLKKIDGRLFFEAYIQSQE